MTERQLLRLAQGIALLSRRAKDSGCWRLTRALHDAGYYAGCLLGEKLAEERNEERNRVAESHPRPTKETRDD